MTSITFLCLLYMLGKECLSVFPWFYIPTSQDWQSRGKPCSLSINFNDKDFTGEVDIPVLIDLLYFNSKSKRKKNHSLVNTQHGTVLHSSLLLFYVVLLATLEQVNPPNYTNMGLHRGAEWLNYISTQPVTRPGFDPLDVWHRVMLFCDPGVW